MPSTVCLPFVILVSFSFNLTMYSVLYLLMKINHSVKFFKLEFMILFITMGFTLALCQCHHYQMHTPQITYI